MSQNKELAKIIKQDKYLQQGETFEEGVNRQASTLADNKEHLYKLQDIFYDERFLPAGRIQASIGAARITTPYNCFVSGIIPDNMDGISEMAKEALQTLRLGGGIGYDFSTIRPSGSRITSLDSTSSGPIGNGQPNSRGFMDWFDAGCATIRSAGHRRGAQMGVLRVDHPDIRHFIRAKREAGRLTNFNVSVAVTDEFMHAVHNDLLFELKFNGTVYEKVSARNLWDEIMRNTWDYAEPGVLFIDTINKKNNLWYCETITATNPCGEQPLPPYGACLLGSFNLTRYIEPKYYIDRVTDEGEGPEYQDGWEFNYEKLRNDISYVVRAMDNVVDRAIYPLPQQELEAKNKRRMGLGVTGLAHTAECLGYVYGSTTMLAFTKEVLTTLRDCAYLASCELAIEKGVFPYFKRNDYCEGAFITTLPDDIRDTIRRTGIRNSHLLSIAPTGTISLSAGNISSGIEPPYNTGSYNRKVYRPDGRIEEFTLTDWCEENYGIKPRASHECSVGDHVAVLCLASSLVDSSVSKTCNVGAGVDFDSFRNVYNTAYTGGASGCTTFRDAGKREGIFSSPTTGSTPLSSKEDELVMGSACYIDPETGMKTCE